MNGAGLERNLEQGRPENLTTEITQAACTGFYGCRKFHFHLFLLSLSGSGQYANEPFPTTILSQPDQSISTSSQLPSRESCSRKWRKSWQKKSGEDKLRTLRVGFDSSSSNVTSRIRNPAVSTECIKRASSEKWNIFQRHSSPKMLSFSLRTPCFCTPFYLKSNIPSGIISSLLE